MTHSLNESLGCSLVTGEVGEEAIFMWQSAIQRLASEGLLSVHQREYLSAPTLRPSDIRARGPRNGVGGPSRIPGGVTVGTSRHACQAHPAQHGGVDLADPGAEVAYLAIPLNPGNFRMQSARVLPGVLVKAGVLELEEKEGNRVLESQGQKVTSPLEWLNLKLEQKQDLQSASHRNLTAATTPLFLSNEFNVSEDGFEASNFLPSVQNALRSTSKEEGSFFGSPECTQDRSFCDSEHNKGIIKALEEQLRIKEAELQRTVQTLLMKQLELDEMSRLSDLKDAEMGLLAEKRRLEERQYKEIAVRFDRACHSLKGKLLTSEADNKTFVKQLRRLMEKYESLKERFAAARKQSLQDLADKRQALKSLEEAGREKERLCAERGHLKEQREAATRAVSDLRAKLRSAEEDRCRDAEERRRVEEEASEMKNEMESLRDRLHESQREVRRLAEKASTVESEKEADLQKLQESRDQIRQLQLKLEEHRAEREFVTLQVKEVRREAKRTQGTLQAEILQRREDYRACKKTADDLRKEAEALSKLVADLKQDKRYLKAELEELRNEKKDLEDRSQLESERFREAMTSLEKERDFLTAELGELRKDYLNVSDRITQRMGQADQDESHASLCDFMAAHQGMAPPQDPQSDRHTERTEDVIQEIKRRLEEEEGRCSQT